MSHRRILLGTLLGVAAVVSIPSASASAATCAFDSTAHTMDVRYRANEGAVTVRASASLMYSDAGVLRSCLDPTTNRAATAANTSKLTIKGPSGAGPQTQMTTLDESAMPLADQNPALDVFVFTGTNDRLVVKKGVRNDSVHLMEQTGLAVGPLIDLDYNGEPDVRMTTGGSVVEVQGGAGTDFIDASSAHSYRTDQYGEDGADVLKGGTQPDNLFGALGNDTLYADGDKQADTVDGGSDIDKAKVDFGLDTFTGIEAFNF